MRKQNVKVLHISKGKCFYNLIYVSQWSLMHTQIKANNTFSHVTLWSEKYIYLVITKTARADNQGTIPITIYSKEKCKVN